VSAEGLQPTPQLHTLLSLMDIRLRTHQHPVLVLVPTEPSYLAVFSALYLARAPHPHRSLMLSPWAITGWSPLPVILNSL
jgi:hypothetical protein